MARISAPRGGALSQTRRDAALYVWCGQALYVGPSLELDTHAGLVGCLAVGVPDTRSAGTFDVSTAQGRLADVRSVLVDARTPHRVTARGGRMAFGYLDPVGPRARACRRAMLRETAPPSGHREEERLARGAGELIAGDDPAGAERWMDLAGARGGVGWPDPRVARAARRLTDGRGPLSAARLAAECGLAESTFLRLFREETGTTLRRYRLWARMLRTAVEVERWGELGTAAVEAGFASPSHFSSAFHTMFGLRPSLLFTGERRVAVVAMPGHGAAGGGGHRRAGAGSLPAG